MAPKNHVRAVRYRKLALAEPPLKGTRNESPQCIRHRPLRRPFLRGLVRELAHASKTDPYLNYVLKTDPHLAHVAVRGVKIWKWLAP
jgi:hypothetical protein